MSVVCEHEIRLYEANMVCAQTNYVSQEEHQTKAIGRRAGVEHSCSAVLVMKTAPFNTVCSSCTCDESWCLHSSCPSWPSNNRGLDGAAIKSLVRSVSYDNATEQ